MQAEKNQLIFFQFTFNKFDNFFPYLIFFQFDFNKFDDFPFISLCLIHMVSSVFVHTLSSLKHQNIASKTIWTVQTLRFTDRTTSFCTQQFSTLMIFFILQSFCHTEAFEYTSFVSYNFLFQLHCISFIEISNFYLDGKYILSISLMHVAFNHVCYVESRI